MRTRQRKDPWRKVVAGLLALVVVVAAVSANGRKEEAKPQVQSPKGQAQSMVYVQDTAEPEELPVHIHEIHYAEEPEKEIPQEEAKPDPEQVFSEEEITAIAKTMWGEALVTNSDMEMAAVAWCILNRVDSSLFPNSIVEVVTAPSQFHRDCFSDSAEAILMEQYGATMGVAEVGRFKFPDESMVDVRIYAYFGIPKSVSKRRRQEMLDGTIRPTKKPDFDNIGKVVCDSLNGLAYHDDAQVVDAQVRKFYSEDPKVIVSISDIGGSKK